MMDSQIEMAIGRTLLPASASVSASGLPSSRPLLSNVCFGSEAQPRTSAYHVTLMPINILFCSLFPMARDL